MVKPQTIIGKIFTMEEPIVRGKLPFYMGLQYPPPPINTGKGKLHVENKTWIVFGPSCKAGTRVRVHHVDSRSLFVELVNPIDEVHPEKKMPEQIKTLKKRGWMFVIPGTILIGMVATIPYLSTTSVSRVDGIIIFVLMVLSVISIYSGATFHVEANNADKIERQKQGKQYIDRIFVLEKPIINGLKKGRILVENKPWDVFGPSCKAGTQVRVTDSRDGMLLVDRADETE